MKEKYSETNGIIQSFNISSLEIRFSVWIYDTKIQIRSLRIVTYFQEVQLVKK